MSGIWQAWIAAGLLAAAPAAAEPEVRQVAPGVHVLFGTSGNVLILPSLQGALIVDGQRPGDLAETVAAVARVSPAPVRYAVVTHWHLDHSGGSEGLAKAGAAIVAHRNVRTRRGTDQFMPTYKRTIPAAPAEALPAVVFDDELEIVVGGERVELRHMAGAHTDGDTIVRLVGADVIHMGDIYFNGIFPFIDRASGGSIQGLIRAVDAVLALADADTVIVPAHGPLATRTDLVDYRAMLAGVAARIAREIATGATREQAIAGKPAAEWREGMVGDEDGFAGAIYDSLKTP
jgi:cyclase